MLIIIIRHGETLENRSRVIQGHLPGQLTENARQQVGDLSIKLLKYGRFDRIISSDLERAKRTACLISKEIPPCKILHEKRLRERCYGEIEGKHVYRLKRMLVENKKDIRGLMIPEAEPYEEFELRVTDFCSRLFAGNPDQRILLVTHAGVMKVILERVLGRPWCEIGNCDGFGITGTVNGNMEVHRL